MGVSVMEQCAAGRLGDQCLASGLRRGAAAGTGLNTHIHGQSRLREAILSLVFVDGQDILVYGPAILIFFETILPLFGASHLLTYLLA